MGQDILQIPADEDGCVYIYNFATDKWQKICDVKSPKDLPQSVKEKLQKAQRTTANG